MTGIPDPEAPQQTAAPVSDRIQIVDALRGVAVLGILAMNIAGFGFHFAAYSDPTVQGGAQGINLWTFVVNAILVDGKMRGVFTLLFGAGMYLLTSRLDERGAADIWYRRTLWLLVLGVVHAYFLWWGEILYPYAVLGLMLYPFRKLSPKWLIVVASVMLLLITAGASFEAWDSGKAREKYAAAKALKDKGQKLTKEQEGDLEKWQERLKNLKPDAERLKKAREAYTTTFIAAVRARAETLSYFHRLPLYSPMLWDFWLMMFLGIALIKTGVLTGERSTGFYVKLALAGYLLGLPLQGVQLWVQITGWFDVVSNAWAWAWYAPGRAGVCLGHVAVCILVFRSRAFSRITKVLAATGRMALTNYVMQSVLCTLFFNVFKQHSLLERYQLYFVVATVWALELVWSPLWLSRFRFGPAEWAWRSLTYWKRQPLRAPVREAV